jgi:predicted aconitase with swiveling domain
MMILQLVLVAKKDLKEKMESVLTSTSVIKDSPVFVQMDNARIRRVTTGVSVQVVTNSTALEKLVLICVKEVASGL